MFCSRCGKKVLEDMRFCPFCGVELVIPDQAEEAAQTGPANAAERPFSFEAASAEAAAAEDLSKLNPRARLESRLARSSAKISRPLVRKPMPTIDVPETDSEDAQEDETTEPPEPPERQPAPIPQPIFPDGDLEAHDSAASLTSESPARQGFSNEQELRKQGFSKSRDGNADTPRARKQEAPMDMFLENEGDARDDADEMDDFDVFEAEQDDRASRHRDRDRHEEHRHHESRSHRRDYDDDDDDDDDDYEDDDGFISRHLRGIVTLAMLVVLVALLAIFALSDPGQRMLARANLPLPLKAETYMKLGYESYQQQDYGKAAMYYERALGRDAGNYDFASSAANLYLMANENDRAERMLKKCIEINPDAVEPYVNLLNLYPNPASRPGDVSRLLEQGYQRTGDARLSPT